MTTKTKSETPVWDSICKEYRKERKMPAFATIAPGCNHPRIFQDEPRDGGGAWYRCTNPKCAKVIDPDDWEAEHDKEWDWYQ